MNRAKATLVISALGNVFLFFGICILLLSPLAPEVERRADVEKAHPAERSMPSAPAIEAADERPAPQPSPIRHEGDLETILINNGWAAEDAATFAIGVRLSRQIDESLDLPEGGYWKPISEDQKASMRKGLELIFDDIVGQELLEAMDFSAYPIPSEKVLMAARIHHDYDIMERRMYWETDYILLEDDRAAMAKLRQERKRDLEALLSPEERIEYDLRRSSRAAGLRDKLQSLEASETEYEAIFRLQDAVAERSLPHNDAEAKIEEILGEDRYRRYSRSGTYRYTQLQEVMRRLSLPAERVHQIYDLGDSFAAQIQEIRAQPSSEEERRAAEDALIGQTYQELSGLLGERGTDLYQQKRYLFPLDVKVPE